jgi:tRNA dimethylallyltransferase
LKSGATIEMTGRIIALVGPTAIGKSSIALQVATRYCGEIVNIDSMQVYRGMDLGTAKPTAVERASVPHHLIDVVDPTSVFSVAEFQSLARTSISDILGRSATPLLVGGSGLYLRAVIYDLSFPMPSASDELRRRYASRTDQESRLELYSRLAEVDPVSAERIGPHNIRRIVRALEVYETTGEPFSSFQNDYDSVPLVYPALIIGLTTDRASLRELIDQRVDKMFDRGLVSEVERLLDAGGFSSTARQALGYREVLDYLDNNASLDETIDKIKSNSRRYAKRQMTWFRRDRRTHWIELTGELLSDPREAARCIEADIDANMEEKGP